MVAGKTGCWRIAALLLAAGVLPAAAEGIYSCVDSKGRHLTADRPIPDCIDREQRELNPSGTIKRTVPPSLTAEERAQLEAKARQEQEERARAAEERRRELALIARYPDKAAHDKERRAALAVADDVTAAARKHWAALAAERQKLNDELEFYKKDPKKIPPRLKRELDENDRQMGEQKRFIANQDSEKQRINARFDDELVLLRRLWGAQPAAAPKPASAPAAPAAKARSASVER